MISIFSAGWGGANGYPPQTDWSKFTTDPVIIPESSDAKNISNYLNTNHEKIILKPKEALDIIPNLPKIYSEPFADSSQIPTALICREIKRKGINVALTGDGGDEIFGGYVRHFKGFHTWSKIRYMPYPLRSKIGGLLQFLPQNIISNSNFSSKQINLYQKIFRSAKRLRTIKSCDELYKSLILENIDYSIFTKSFLNELNNYIFFI